MSTQPRTSNGQFADKPSTAPEVVLADPNEWLLSLANSVETFDSDAAETAILAAHEAGATSGPAGALAHHLAVATNAIRIARDAIEYAQALEPRAAHEEMFGFEISEVGGFNAGRAEVLDRLSSAFEILGVTP